MTVGKISGFFQKKLVFRNICQTCVKTSDIRLTRYTTILNQLSTSTAEPLRNSSLWMWPLLIHGFFSHFELFFRTFVKMFSELLSKLHLTFAEEKFDFFFKWICCSFYKFEHTFIKVLTVKFHHCSQNSFQHVQRNNWRKRISSHSSNFFLTLRDFFWKFWQKQFRKVVKIEFFVTGRDI